mgnify:CR=1 FL=1
MLLLQFTWNLLGMMNNCVYRVKIHPEALPGGGFGLRFEHPTVAGPIPGGWMNRAEGDGARPQQVGRAALQTPASVILFPTACGHLALAAVRNAVSCFSRYASHITLLTLQPCSLVTPLRAVLVPSDMPSFHCNP